MTIDHHKSTSFTTKLVPGLANFSRAETVVSLVTKFTFCFSTQLGYIVLWFKLGADFASMMRFDGAVFIQTFQVGKFSLDFVVTFYPTLGFPLMGSIRFSQKGFATFLGIDPIISYAL